MPVGMKCLHFSIALLLITNAIAMITLIMEVAMIREASAMKVRNNLGELLNEVTYRHDAIIIQKSGKSVAAIVDMDLFEKIRLMQTEFDALCLKLASQSKGTDTECLQSDLQEAVKAARLSA